MKIRYGEGLAIHTDPSRAFGAREGDGAYCLIQKCSEPAGHCLT